MKEVTIKWIKVSLVVCLAAGDGGEHRECFIDPDEVVGVAEVYDTNFEPNHFTSILLRSGGGYRVLEPLYNVMAQLKRMKSK